MYTLDVVEDTKHGHQLPPLLYKQPLLAAHSRGKILTPARELSFAFLARRRILYQDLARHLENLSCGNLIDQAQTPVRALRD